MSEAEYRKIFGRDYVDQRKIQTVKLAYAKPSVISVALGQLKSDVGKIVVDEGAKCALLNKKSLLSVGVTGIIGDFLSHDTVSVIDNKKCEFARGKSGLSSKQLEKVMGRRFDKEVIHRDDIVILQ
jgi:glutamate 5-kinase